MKKLEYALEEEIGDPDLFVGRKQELEFFLRCCQGVKKRLSQSTGILSRRKKGKTALVQRLYNILFHHQDPELVPFYFKIPESPHSQVEFSSLFYQSLLSQYFAFRENDPALVEQVPDFEELKEYARNDQFLLKDIGQMESLKSEKSPAREQILRDTKLIDFLTDRDLETLLHKLVKADIIAKGSNNYRFRGLGDEIFAEVFRKIYGEEIENLKPHEIEKEYDRKLPRTQKQFHKWQFR